MTAHSDGSYEENSLIYTIRTRKGSSWRIVAVSFVDELIEGRLKDCLILLARAAADCAGCDDCQQRRAVQVYFQTDSQP